MPAATREVRFRLLRADDRPLSNPHGFAYEFGLQDTKGVIIAGERAANGGFVFDFSLAVKLRADGKPSFTGRFASGPADDRFVYLSWRAVERGDYINRVKARLGNIDWATIEAADTAGARLTADLTDWRPGDPRKFPDWRIG